MSNIRNKFITILIVMQALVLSTPPGEDDLSLKRHIRDMQVESQKRDPNLTLILDKMARTSAHRKAFCDKLDGTADVKIYIDTILQEFPFLRIRVLVSQLTFIYNRTVA
jgi:hypothetical protein